MINKTTMVLAFVSGCMAMDAATPPATAAPARRTVVMKHPPVANQGDTSESWSARQNVIESKQYERLLQTNPGFRRTRMQKECGPINDSQLRQSCLASFNQR
jgi:hypothetical protein